MPKVHYEPEPQAAPVFDSRIVYAGWKCKDCGVTTGGFIEPFDYKPRRCMGVPKTGRTDGQRICGALMEQFYRAEDAA